jgi:hypothetical protein
VQEKKVKKVSEMNLDSSNAKTNGVSPGWSVPNGDFSFPTGGLASLRLPVVVVMNPNFC